MARPERSAMDESRIRCDDWPEDLKAIEERMDEIPYGLNLLERANFQQFTRMHFYGIS